MNADPEVPRSDENKPPTIPYANSGPRKGGTGVLRVLLIIAIAFVGAALLLIGLCFFLAR